MIAQTRQNILNVTNNHEYYTINVSIFFTYYTLKNVYK